MNASVYSTKSPTEKATTATTVETTTAKVARYLWAVTRLCMGWVFLWPFLDKLFGLGHETTAAHAWINGRIA